MTFLLPNITMYGQTFVGTSTDEMKAYECTIRLNTDSTINFVYKRQSNGVYGEHIGTISKVKDTLYRISATMTLGQFSMKSYNNESLYIQLDSNIARQLDKIQVEYADGKTRKQLQGYDKSGNPIPLLKIPIDKKLFNEKKGKDYLTLTINRKNILTENLLSFRIPYGSAASLTSGEKEEFDVVIKNNKLYSTNNPPSQTGHIKLTKIK